MGKKKTIRKRSQYSGRKYKRYTKGFWPRYKKQRRFRYQRVIANIKRRLKDLPNPYETKKTLAPDIPGRKPVPPKTILMCVMFKELFDLSYMDTESFLKWVTQGHPYLMGKVPAANTIQEHVQDIPLVYLENMLKEVIKILENNEVILVMDATGLSTHQYGCWQTVRKASKKKKRKFVKLHISMDLKSNLILMGFSSKGWKGDHPFGIRMIDKLRGKFKRFGITVEEGLADSGYRSRKMAIKIGEMGGNPLIKVRSNDTARKGGSKEWREMVLQQRERPNEFKKSYCYRVVIEGIISALKHIFGALVRSRKRHNQDVEVLTRLILWNFMHIEPEQF